MVDESRIAVDGSVTEEKLNQLLAEQAEHPELDYKSFLDLTDAKTRVEFAKDVAAMQSVGGYLVVGVDNKGAPTTTHGAIKPAHFDEASLRQAVGKWVPDGGRITSAVHQVGGIDVAIVFIGRRRDGFTVMKEQGVNPETGKLLFTRGDVIVRHGTSSERWSQTDIDRLLAERDERVRQEARAQYAAETAAAARAQGLVAGPLGQISWELSEEDFTEAFTAAIRAGDRTIIRRVFLELTGVAQALWVDRADDDLEQLIDRAVAAAAVALTYSVDLLPDALRVLDGIYQLGSTTFGRGDGRRAQRLWWNIVTRVEALGGLAVRLQEWDAAHALALRPFTTVSDSSYSSWLRHGYVEAARVDLITPVDGSPANGALVAFARKHAGELVALRPDYRRQPTASLAGVVGDVDAILDSIVQFDVLWCLLAVAEGRESDQFPSFAYFAEHRATPVFRRIAEDPQLRAQLLPGRPDQAWRELMWLVVDRASSLASQAGRTFNVPDDVRQFLGYHQR
jgi:hypothetical protein